MQLTRIALFTLLVLALLAAQSVFAQKKSDFGSRRIDEKVKGLDESTRKRVLAMQQAGMPQEAIAKKIQYEVGSTGTARKMLEKINVEEGKKQWAQQQRQRFETKRTVNMQKITAERKMKAAAATNAANKRK